LPHGLERRLGIVRSLATRPAFLLLDEPAAGLNEQESDELVQTLTTIRDDFLCGLVVIEHDMRLIMRLCERIQVLDHGKTIAVGAPAEVRADPAVLTAYLGTKGAADAGR
jgi:branched-chain amino acid transport system ATP-binding protein